MTRQSLNSSVATAVAGATLYACHLFKLEFPSSTLYITDFGETIVWSGMTFLPAAKVLGWSGYEENNDLHPRRVTVDLAVTQDLVDAATGDAFQNSLVNIWIATLNSNRTILGVPYNCAANLRMSTAALSIDEGKGTLSLSCETREVYGERNSAALCTTISQQLRYTGDTVLNDLAVTANKLIEWGGKLDSPGVRVGGGTNYLGIRVGGGGSGRIAPGFGGSP